MPFLEKLGGVISAFSNSKAEIEYNENTGIIAFFGRGSGVTTIVVNLASVLAAKGCTVCVVDANLAAFNVYRYLIPETGSGSKIEPGSYLDRDVTPTLALSEIVNQSRIKNVDYITPGVQSLPIDWCRASSSIFSGLIDEIKRLYDFVIIDAGNDINYEPALESARIARKFYVMRPEFHNLEQLCSINQALSSIGIAPIIEVIQSLTHGGDLLSSSDIEDSGCRMVGIFPYSVDVADSDSEYDLIPTKHKDVKKASGTTLEACNDLIEQLATALLHDKEEMFRQLSGTVTDASEAGDKNADS